MKTTIKAALSAVAILLISTCSFAASAKSNGMVIKDLNVNSFKEIEASSAINVIYTQNTDKCSATVSMTQNAEERFEYSCDGKTLKIWLNSKGSNKSASIKVTVRISAPYLSNVKISGASNFNAKTLNQVNKKLELKCSGASTVRIEKAILDKMDIECSGASNVMISNLNCSKVEAEASGASKVILKGDTREAEFDASGASNINAENLKASTGEIEASGASKVVANILNLTKRETSGMSTIRNR